jgi:hypothetical protein
LVKEEELVKTWKYTGIARVITVLSLMLLLLGNTAIASADSGVPPEALACDPQVPDSPDVIYFSETCHQVKGDFKTNWESMGIDLGQEGVSHDEALMLTGYPLTGYFDHDGLFIQVYERAVLEFHKEFDTGDRTFVILRRLLGKEAFEQRKSQWAPDVVNPTSPINDSDCQFFPETGHNMCGGLLSFWQHNGGLMAFGYPLMEASFETMPDGSKVWVQYTERQRLEFHDENADPWKVLLGRLGANFLDSLTGGGTNPGADCTAAKLPDFEPVDGTVWNLDASAGSGGVIVPAVWTNWASVHLDGQVQTLIPEGQKVALKGGGSASQYPKGCEEQAKADIATNTAMPFKSLDELKALGIVYDPSSVDCTPQIFTHDPQPNVWWDLEGGDQVYRVVQFWTNWPKQDQSQVKLIMNPGQNNALGGGGQQAVFPAECQAAAQQWLTDSPGALTTLDALAKRGLVK